jgi:F-type H+-transporting ATPase subunit delta
MRKHPVAFRYASAVFEYAQERNVLDQTAEELEVIAKVLEDTNLYEELFRHPKISTEEKKRVLTESFTGKVSESSLNLLLLLADKNRLDIFGDIAGEFKALAYEAKGVAEATVYSAKPLTGDEETAVAEVFTRKSGKQQLLINNVVDKEIIGGLKVRIGDRVYDGSVAKRLERFQQRMIFGKR